MINFLEKSRYKIFFEYLMIIIGTTLLALSINMFFSPRNMVTGGVSGIGIILQYYSTDLFGFSVPLWLSNFVFNAPLFIIGWCVLGMKFIQRSLFATVYLTFSLYFTSFIPSLEGVDMLLTSVFGGVLAGVGLGLVFRYSATTGGSDIAATIIHKYLPHISISRLMFILDTCIVILGFFAFGPVNAMYAIISIYITTKVISGFLEGISFAKAAFVISEKDIEIGNALMSELNRGVTSLYGQGVYTKLDKNVLLCVVSTKEVHKLKEVVGRIDNRAFVIVADVREVLGEGFQVI